MAETAVRVVVIGAGFGGIAGAVRLLQDGVEDLVVIDRADGVGGVWRANSYPGAECDVPSHLYSLSFHPKPDWTHRYAGQAEILDYLEDVTATFNLAPRLRLRTEVTACRWDDPAGHWWVDLVGPDGTAETVVADVVVAACGQLSRPAAPPIPGLEDFAGPIFHSARWRHDVELAGKRVAVIGTGASAIQFVPPVAESAGHLTLFQRSAPYVIGKPDRDYTELEKRIYATVPGALSVSRAIEFSWHELLGVPFVFAPALMALPEAAWRRRLRKAVTDPVLREQVQPDDRMGCKRLLRSTEWYAALSREDVDVVSTPIEAVTAEGVRTTDGVVHEADVLVLGTGFAATEFLTPMRVQGRGGRDLHTEWSGGARAYLGTAVPGFPNFFLLYGPGTNLGHSSIVYMIESQVAWVRGAVRALRQRGLQWVDVRPEVQSEWDASFRAASARTVWETGCSSWYTVDGRNTNNWPGSTLSFRRRTRHFRLDDVESRPRPVPTAVT